jgi:hypothetical protein
MPGRYLRNFTQNYANIAGIVHRRNGHSSGYWLNISLPNGRLLFINQRARAIGENVVELLPQKVTILMQCFAV